MYVGNMIQHTTAKIVLLFTVGCCRQYVATLCPTDMLPWYILVMK